MKKLLLLLVFLLLPFSTHAAVARDVAARSTGTCNTTFVSDSFTAASGAALYVYVGDQTSTAADHVTSVKLDGTTALTLIVKGTSRAPLYVYELAGFSVSGAHTVTVTCDANIAVGVDVLTFTGAGNNDGNSLVAADADAPATTNLTVNTDQSWQMTAIATLVHGPQTASTGFVVQISGGQPREGDSNGALSTGAHTISWTWTGGTDNYNLITVNIPPGSLTPLPSGSTPAFIRSPILFQ